MPIHAFVKHRGIQTHQLPNAASKTSIVSIAAIGNLLRIYIYILHTYNAYYIYVLPCYILFLCFSVHLALRLPRLEKREQILVFFVRLFDLCLFGLVGFLFLLVSGKIVFLVCDCDTPWTFLLSIFFYISNLCFRFNALTELGACMRTQFLCISVIRVASGPRVKLAAVRVL